MTVPFGLTTIPLTQQLARVLDSQEANARYAGLPKGTVRGRIKSVDDPLNRGRVLVVFDAMNAADRPQIEGTGEEYVQERIASGADTSHWLDTSPAFMGRQPPGLVGKRVNIAVSDGQYQYAILQDVLFDPDILTVKAGSKLKMPNNSPMTRLPCYPSGKLPPATEENVGCTIVELGGPQGDDWLMVCLKRAGEYKWVRHIDRLHYHTGQLPDSDGDSEKRTYDDVIETTGDPQEGSD